MELVNRIPAQIVDAFEVGAAALFLADKQKVYRSGPVVPQLDTESLKAIMARDEPVIDAANSVCFLPVRLGVRPVGSLGISGTMLSRQTLEAIGTLVAIAMEHARAVEQLGQTEAAREGEKLRTALLDAVTHALRTPLTSIKASVTNLLSNPSLADEPEAGTTDDHQRRKRSPEPVSGRSGGNGPTGRGRSGVEVEPHPIDDVISGRARALRASLGNRSVNVKVAQGLPRSARRLGARAGSAGPSDRERQSLFAARSANHDHGRSERRYYNHQRRRSRRRNRRSRSRR